MPPKTPQEIRKFIEQQVFSEYLGRLSGSERHSIKVVSERKAIRISREIDKEVERRLKAYFAGRKKK